MSELSAEDKLAVTEQLLRQYQSYVIRQQTEIVDLKLLVKKLEKELRDVSRD